MGATVDKRYVILVSELFRLIGEYGNSFDDFAVALNIDKITVLEVQKLKRKLQSCRAHRLVT